MDTYTKRERTIYLLGMLGQNLIYGVIGTGLTYYFQSVIFLPALAISTITLLSKIAEFLCDPYVGMRIDRSHNTKGKCRTYLIFSPLPIFIFSLLCFLNRPYTAAETSTARLGILLAAAMDIAKLNDKKPQGPQRIAGTGTDRCRNLRCRYQFAAIAVISGCGQSLFQTAKRPYLRAANGDRLGLWQFFVPGHAPVSAGRLLYPGAHDRPAGRKAQPMAKSYGNVAHAKLSSHFALRIAAHT